MTLSVALSLHASVVVYESFEDAANMVFQAVKHAQLSTTHPLSGKQHLLAQRQSFSAAIPFQLSNTNFSKIIITCHVDPRGKETILEFSTGSSSVSVFVDPKTFGYRQVIAELPLSFFSDKTVYVRSLGETGSFLLDDLRVVGAFAPLCERPEPTQVLANLNGESRDFIRSLKIDGELIQGSDVVSADGYVLISDAKRVNNPVFVLGFQPEDETFKYAYAIWADTDRNGVFSVDERIALSFADGAIQVPVELNEVTNGTLALRIRMLDPRSNDMNDAYSGNTWGQSIDLFVELNEEPSTARCRCELPDYYMDLSGKKLNSLEGVPAGMYLKVNQNCTEKIIVAW